jgi:iron complex transport system substrate-binding protein
MRIASLVPSATEMLFAAGLGDSVVAVTHECDYPPAAASRPRLTRTVIPPGLSAREIDAEVKRVVGEGRALYELDERELERAAPDLIVTQAVCEVCAVSYEDVAEVAARLPGSPAVLRQDPSTLEETLDDVTRLGAAAGVPEQASRLRSELEGRLAGVRAAVAGAERPRVLALEWLDPPFTAGHWVPEMIAAAGGDDPLGQLGADSRRITWDDIAVSDPELIIVAPCGYGLQEAVAVANRLPQVTDATVYAVDANSYFARPGPRVAEGVELLAHLFHPDLFAWRHEHQPWAVTRGVAVADRYSGQQQ